MAQRGKVKLKRSGLNEEAMVFTMAEEGRSIWRSRSQPVVTYLHGGVILLLLVLCACTSARSQQPSGIRVVSTIAQIGCLASEIGGNRISSEVLVRGEINPHSYELVKGDDEKIQQADLLLYNGLGLEHGASVVSLVRAHPNALGVADAIQKLHPDKILWKGQVPDPHVWMDVALWAEAVDPIADKLCALDPAGQEEFRARAQVLKQKMLQTNEEMFAVLQHVPAEKRYLITSHDAFGYFTRSYLAVPGETAWQERFSAPEGLAPDGQLNPADLKAIILCLQKHKIEILFPESSVSRDSIRKLAAAGRELGLNIRICQDVLYGDTFRGTYLDAMKHNAETIARGLDGSSR